MKKLYFFLALLLFPFLINAQFGSQIIISTSASFPRLVKTVDIDNDNDLDVIANSDSALLWFENIGNGIDTFQNIIDTGYFFGITSGDIDNDGKIDILSAICADTLYWYKNLGSGVFSQKKAICFISKCSSEITKLVDLDFDGDLDIVSGLGSIMSAFCYIENLGNGIFGPVNIIPSTSGYYITPSMVITNDIDNDGDIDIVVSDNQLNSITWIENIGGLSFDYPKTITVDVSQPISISLKDINNDNTPDIICADWAENEISWFMNLGGGMFSNELLIYSSSYEEPVAVFVSDIDVDGDNDIISASYQSDKISFFENSGGNFLPEQIINIPDSDTIPLTGSNGNADGAFFVHAADIDGDNDMEIFSTSTLDNKIAYYDNLLATSTKTLEINDYSFIAFPIPFQNNLTIYYKGKIDNAYRLTLFDITGKEVYRKENVTNNKTTINLNQLPNGMYIVIGTDSSGDQLFKERVVAQ